MPDAGFLTRDWVGSGDPNSRVRRADVRTCAFAPRRVASSETARKATTERTAARAARRRANLLDEGAAPHSADAERRSGRRSGKLAMFSLRVCVRDTRLQSQESACRALR